MKKAANLCKCEEQSTYTSEHDASYEQEGDVLRPEGDVKAQAQPVHYQLQAARHRVLRPHAVQYYVDC